jgi:hypothetical protein
MQVTQLWAQCLLGMAGGFACELLHWYSLSRKPGGAARFSRHVVYWITTAGMILVAGAMPVQVSSRPYSMSSTPNHGPPTNRTPTPERFPIPAFPVHAVRPR